MTPEIDRAGQVAPDWPESAFSDRGGSRADGPATGLPPPHEHTWAVIPRPYVSCACGATMPSNGDTLPQPAVDVDALAGEIADEIWDLDLTTTQVVAATPIIAKHLRAHLAQQPPAPGVVEAVQRWLPFLRGLPLTERSQGFQDSYAACLDELEAKAQGAE